MYQGHLSLFLCLALCIPFAVTVDISLLLTGQPGTPDLTCTCTSIAPGVCCMAPSPSGADHVSFQHLTAFDIAAIWKSRLPLGATANEHIRGCSGRVLQSHSGPGAFVWDIWGNPAVPMAHGASYVTLPRSLPPSEEAVSWMLVEGLLGLVWGGGKWFASDATQKAFGGSPPRSKMRRDIRSGNKGQVFAGPPRGGVSIDMVELGGKKYRRDGNSGSIFVDDAGTSINLTDILGVGRS